MENKEVFEQVKKLEEQLNELTSMITEQEIKEATEEEKIKYLQLISEIKTKIEILKNL